MLKFLCFALDFALVSALVCAPLVSMLAAPSADSRVSQRWQIITWGPNTTGWDQKLHVTGMRLGCSDTPPSCMKVAGAASRDGLEIFLGVPLKVETENYASEYAKLSRGTSAVAEIGIDDFAGQYRRLLTSGASEAAAVLDSFIEGVKSSGSQLKFGATIYEDELESPELADSSLPAAIRAEFDIVHLYLHYRSNGARTAEYCEKARKHFPHAKIVLGVYAYDRISYIPCRKGDATPCSKQEELDFFAAALDADIAALKSGAAAGLEFYPGSFGREDEWSGWNKPGICRGRRQECIDNTKALRALVADRFKKDF